MALVALAAWLQSLCAYVRWTISCLYLLGFGCCCHKTTRGAKVESLADGFHDSGCVVPPQLFFSVPCVEGEQHPSDAYPASIHVWIWSYSLSVEREMSGPRASRVAFFCSAAWFQVLSTTVSQSPVWKVNDVFATRASEP